MNSVALSVQIRPAVPRAWSPRPLRVASMWSVRKALAGAAARMAIGHARSLRSENRNGRMAIVVFDALPSLTASLSRACALQIVRCPFSCTASHATSVAVHAIVFVTSAACSRFNRSWRPSFTLRRSISARAVVSCSQRWPPAGRSDAACDSRRCAVLPHRSKRQLSLPCSLRCELWFRLGRIWPPCLWRLPAMQSAARPFTSGLMAAPPTTHDGRGVATSLECREDPLGALCVICGDDTSTSTQRGG